MNNNLKRTLPLSFFSVFKFRSKGVLGDIREDHTEAAGSD